MVEKNFRHLSLAGVTEAFDNCLRGGGLILGTNSEIKKKKEQRGFLHGKLRYNTLSERRGRGIQLGKITGLLNHTFSSISCIRLPNEEGQPRSTSFYYSNVGLQ